MNVETGEIKEFESKTDLEEAMASGDWVKLDKKPNRNCRYCYGRGPLGRNLSTHKYVSCRCVKERKIV